MFGTVLGDRLTVKLDSSVGREVKGILLFRSVRDALLEWIQVWLTERRHRSTAPILRRQREGQYIGCGAIPFATASEWTGDSGGCSLDLAPEPAARHLDLPDPADQTLDPADGRLDPLDDRLHSHHDPGDDTNQRSERSDQNYG